MQRQTRLCVTVGHAHLGGRLIADLADGGADAFVVPVRLGDTRWVAELVGQVRDAEISVGRPFAIVADLIEPLEVTDAIATTISKAGLQGVDFLALSCEGGSEELNRLRDSLRDAGKSLRLIAKLDQARDFDDVEGVAKSCDGVMVTEVGLRSLPPSTAAIAQKMVSRHCQVAAKPCLVARNLRNIVPQDGDCDLASVFDLANVAFDHVDCVVSTETPVQRGEVMAFLKMVSDVLVAAESYLEVTDRPVRVGFGQPPHTAALAYAIRHILKMQEIAAVAVYSITGSTSRVIAKNWIACPILAFSSRRETARAMCLYHGVTSRHVEEQLDSALLLETAGTLAQELKIAVPGDRIIVVSGHPDQTQDQANGFIIETIR